MAGQVVWTHSDPRGLNTATEDALARAKAQDWDGSPEARADLRALVLAAFAACANLSPAPVQMTEGAAGVVPQVKPDRSDFADAQQALLEGTAILLAGGRDPRKFPPLPAAKVRVTTEGGGAPTQDVGFGPAAAVAVIGVAAVVGVVVWQYFSQANELEYIKITSDANVKKHAQTVGAATNMVQAHLEREDKAGQSLPWDEGELLVLNELMSSSSKLADWKPPEPKSIPDTKKVTDATAGAIRDVGAGVKQGTSWGLPLLALGVAWALS